MQLSLVPDKFETGSLPCNMTFGTIPPLAERMRPSTLTELVGQEHLTGEGGILWQALRTGQVPSMILWGPPGTGKTTLANIVANEVKRPFYAKCHKRRR